MCKRRIILKYTEEQLKHYAAPLSNTEDQKCKNAINEITKALKKLGYASSFNDALLMEKDTYAYTNTLKRSFDNREIQIFIQGSYANNTCVRGESDVDIAIVRRDINESAFGKNFSPYVPLFEQRDNAIQLKNNVEKRLKEEFPYCVHRANKSIKLDGNTYRKKADNVPCVSMHYYYKSEERNYNDFAEGVTIFADDGQVINNFPKQHISNGKAKNNNTNYYYKKMVRIIKKIRYDMEESGYSSASQVSSFGLESLLWNIPDNIFMKYVTYRFEFEEIIKYLYHNMECFTIYKEANGIKPLCCNMEELDKYKNFVRDLYYFYSY